MQTVDLDVFALDCFALIDRPELARVVLVVLIPRYNDLLWHDEQILIL